ncbi:MAG: dicarboxylate/amino acid:cation symporter [Chthoniobacterales bacterium]
MRWMFGLKLHWQILIAMGLAFVVGISLPEDGVVAGVNVTAICAYVGRLFLKLLQMLVVPLIATSIISAIARLGEENAFGRLGLRTAGYYVMTTALAVCTGLLVVNLVGPGRVAPDVSERMIASLGESREEVASKVAADTTSGAVLAEVFERMIPKNIIDAAGNNADMLAIIFFAVLFGFFITKLDAGPRAGFLGWWESAYAVMLLMTDWVILFAPIGVFGLVAATVAETGFDALGPVITFFFTVAGALAIHLFVTLPILLKLLGRSPLLHFRQMMPALLTAFSTASSSSTVPVSLDCLGNNDYNPRKVNSFVVPLGATINMDGTALYECVAAMFIAQIYGIEMTFGTQFLVVFLALATSIGVAGVPAASLVAIVIILGAIGLPMEAIGLILAVDRVLDMCRTAVNVFSDSCGAAVIGGFEMRRGGND